MCEPVLAKAERLDVTDLRSAETFAAESTDEHVCARGSNWASLNEPVA